ncbi:MAG: hypothetical protein N2316_07875 [Spirochaetes bacterium]|nr:hypothetical protein [Spirochaetota bacterium]
MNNKLFAMGLVVFVFTTSPAFPFDIAIGAKAGYFAWLPMYADMGTGGAIEDIRWGAGILYGPIISIGFTPEISLSMAGLMGRQVTSWDSRFRSRSIYNEIEILSGNYDFDVFRGDFDSVLIYRLTTNFRIFAGYKYLLMKTELSFSEIRTNPSDNSIDFIEIINLKLNHFGHGPAFGIGYSYPFGSPFFMAITLSGVYMWGEFEFEAVESYQNEQNFIRPKPESELPVGKRVPITHAGINVEPSIGMAPGEGMPIVMLGVRYQHFLIKIEDIPNVIPEKWMNDKMVGLFVSAVFTF